MTPYDFGDVVLLPFPFTDQTGSKKRPAVVVSSRACNAARPDVIVMAVTTQDRLGNFGETLISDWKKAGLASLSVVKPICATVKKTLVQAKLGKLQPDDRKALQDALKIILG